MARGEVVAQAESASAQGSHHIGIHLGRALTILFMLFPQ